MGLELDIVPFPLGVGNMLKLALVSNIGSSAPLAKH